jgi:hypothetical protein
MSDRTGTEDGDMIGSGDQPPTEDPRHGQKSYSFLLEDEETGSYILELIKAEHSSCSLPLPSTTVSANKTDRGFDDSKLCIPSQAQNASKNHSRLEPTRELQPQPRLVRTRRIPVSEPGAFHVSPPGHNQDEEQFEDEEIYHSNGNDNYTAATDLGQGILLEATLVEDFKDDTEVPPSELVQAEPLISSTQHWFSSKTLCLLITFIMIIAFIVSATL